MSVPRYAYLGPAGTFTEEALLQVVTLDEAVLLPQTDVGSAIAAVRSGQADHAVVAIESTAEGGVTATLDALAAGEPLVILREMLVPVQFTLAPGNYSIQGQLMGPSLMISTPETAVTVPTEAPVTFDFHIQ